jgi:hypothetical protein
MTDRYDDKIDELEEMMTKIFTNHKYDDDRFEILTESTRIYFNRNEVSVEVQLGQLVIIYDEDKILTYIDIDKIVYIEDQNTSNYVYEKLEEEEESD